jgi:hypothetical protein
MVNPVTLIIYLLENVRQRSATVEAGSVSSPRTYYGDCRLKGWCAKRELVAKLLWSLSFHTPTTGPVHCDLESSLSHRFADLPAVGVLDRSHAGINFCQPDQ